MIIQLFDENENKPRAQIPNVSGFVCVTVGPGGEMNVHHAGLPPAALALASELIMERVVRPGMRGGGPKKNIIPVRNMPRFPNGPQ